MQPSRYKRMEMLLFILIPILIICTIFYLLGMEQITIAGLYISLSGIPHIYTMIKYRDIKECHLIHIVIILILNIAIIVINILPIPKQSDPLYLTYQRVKIGGILCLIGLLNLWIYTIRLDVEVDEQKK